MVYTPRRVSRPVSMSSTTSTRNLANAVVLMVVLTIILLSRCDSDHPDKESQGSWVDYLITPKHLRLPKRVIDVQQEQARDQHSESPRQ